MDLSIPDLSSPNQNSSCSSISRDELEKETENRPSNLLSSLNFGALDFHADVAHVLPSNLPEHACRYCGFDKTNGIARCDDCLKWFCNGPGEEHSTHIIDHLTRSGHKRVSLHKKSSFGDIKLECANCDCRNIFSLGFINPTPDEVVLLCRQPCANQESLEPIQWTTEDWQALICERQILTWLVRSPKLTERSICFNVTSKQIIDLEELWQKEPDAILSDLQNKPKLQPDFQETMSTFKNSDEYIQFFKNLVQIESDHSKSLSEKPLQEGLEVEWIVKSKKKTMATFVLKPTDNEVDISLGDQLLLKHLESRWAGEGCVIKVTKVKEGMRDKVTLKMSQNFVLTEKTADFVLERVWNYTSFNRMQIAINKMGGKYPPMEKKIFDIILGNRDGFDAEQFSKESNNSVQLQSSDHLPELNSSQVKAVKHALERPLSLIQGPPGTGKTVTSASIIYHMAKSNTDLKKGKVLVCAPSNVAVDHLAEKIHQTGLKVVRVYAKTQESIESPVSFLGLHNQVKHLPEYKQYRQSRESHVMGDVKSVSNQRGSYKKLMDSCELQVIAASEVVMCTCIGSGTWQLDGFKFDYVLIDECTQSSEPECLVPIVKGAKQLVLIGDQCQLGPVILNKQAGQDGLSKSLFERLLKLGIRPQCLQIQYRMHPIIAQFPSTQFYQNFVLNGVDASDHKLKELDRFWPVAGKPMFFFSSHMNEEIASSGNSYLNRGEAKIVVQLITKLIQCGLKGDQIGVITPYLGQRRYLKQYIKSSKLMTKEEHNGIEVSSVDSFQGREKDFIIISAVRSNKWQGVGFLRDPRRLNVALTRAKYGLVVIGNPILLRRDCYWNQLLYHFKNHNCLLEGSRLNELYISKLYLPFPRKMLNQNPLPIYGSPLDQLVVKLKQMNLNQKPKTILPLLSAFNPHSLALAKRKLIFKRKKARMFKKQNKSVKNDSGVSSSITSSFDSLMTLKLADVETDSNANIARLPSTVTAEFVTFLNSEQSRNDFIESAVNETDFAIKDDNWLF